MIIDCIADLHGFYPKLEGGDLLIVAGDLTARDTKKQHSDFNEWLISQNYKKKVYIAGNHDNFLMGYENHYSPETNVEYLCDSGTEYVLEYPSLDPATQENEGKIIHRNVLKIWGSPWTKTFEGMNPKCKAFTCDTEEQLAEKWAMIPDNIDILITHGPPYGILDQVEVPGVFSLCYPAEQRYESVGSKSLFERSRKLKNLRLFCFGHIHESYSVINTQEMTNSLPMLLSPNKPNSLPIIVNCSHVNERYQPVNKPVRIVL